MFLLSKETLSLLTYDIQIYDIQILIVEECTMLWVKFGGITVFHPIWAFFKKQMWKILSQWGFYWKRILYTHKFISILNEEKHDLS